MSTAALVAVLLAACPQPADQSCVSVPLTEARDALACVAADLPACLEGRHLDAQACAVDVHAWQGRHGAAVTRGDRLQVLLDEMPAPPVTPWWERPGFVAPAAVAATLGALLWAGAL